MSNKSVREATDLIRHKCYLKITCACGYSRHMTGMEALRKFNKFPIKRYHERLQCSACAGKRARVEIEFEERR